MTILQELLRSLLEGENQEQNAPHAVTLTAAEYDALDEELRDHPFLFPGSSPGGIQILGVPIHRYPPAGER